MNVIEIGGSSIRLVRERDGRLLGLESWQVPAGADPLLALASAPLPRPLGRVAVLIHHDEMLLLSQLQPTTNPERLDRMVRFELASMAGDGAESTSLSWHAVRLSLGDDLRILTLMAKQPLIQRLRDSLAPHGGRLSALLPTSLGVFHAWKAQHGEEKGAAVVVDIGGQRLHIALVLDGALLFLRTQSPGTDELVKAVAAHRGLPEPEAAKLVARLGKGAPADLHELIAKQAGTIAGLITATVRFAKAQLKLDAFEPSALYISGSGAQVVGLAETLRERMGVPTRIINPFCGLLSALPVEELDREAALPSPWTPAIGAALAKGFELDALQDDRARTRQFWHTDGVLRVTAAAVLTLMILALVRQQFALHAASAAIAVLKGENDSGLVPVAEAAEKRLQTLQDQRAQEAARLHWLDTERRPGRVAVELLAAISAQENPTTCPVTLISYAVDHDPGQTVVVIDGYARSAGHSGTETVLKEFEAGLKNRYPLISAMIAMPEPIGPDNQKFQYRIEIKDKEDKEN